MPRVSIIVPVYNVERFLHRCVNSILGQTCSDFELILVDDGSPDNCGAICDEYARRDSRIHVIHQENGGLSAARNAGIDWIMQHSDSQWLTFIDSDDWIHRDYLKILIQAAEQNDVSVAACELVRVSDVQEDCEVPEFEICCLDAQNAYIQYYGMCMTACCKIYRKFLVEDLRFPVGKLHEDCYVTHIPLFQAGRIAICDVPLYYYYTNPGSITRMKWTEKRLQEVESHELRSVWLKEHGFDRAYCREIRVYVRTIYEHTAILAKLCCEDNTYVPNLRTLRKKLLYELKKARKLGLYAFEREYLWLYLMAYPFLPVWYVGQKFRGKYNSM